MRNREFVALLVLTAVNVLVLAGLLVRAIARGSLVFPDVYGYIRIIQLPERGIFASSNAAVVTASLVCLMYTLASTIILLHYFEKTQSSEVIFFAGFLCTTLIEGSRLFIPSIGMYTPINMLILDITKLTASGRMIAPLLFLFAAILNGQEQRQHTGRNIAVLVCAVAIIGLTMPVNTIDITSTLIYQFGYGYITTIYMLIVSVITTIAMAVTAVKSNTKETLWETVGFSLLIAGYYLICLSDCWLLLVPGCMFLTAGTYLYLRNLHRQYMWN